MNNLDMMTDEELHLLRTSLMARRNRIRTMVLSGRMDRTTFDQLGSELDAVNGELEKRGLSLDALAPDLR